MQDHAAAVLALLEADNTAPALNVHDGKVPADVDPMTEPYVLVYFDASYPDLAFDGGTNVFELRIICHSVAANAHAARIVSGRVADNLLDVTPSVSGRVCWPIRWSDGAPPERHEQTGVSVMDQVDVYVLRSVPQ